MKKRKIKKEEKKNIFQKVSYFLLEDESLISWLVCLVICFLIIKFLFFPFFSLLFSTSLPFVIIESESMEHNGNFAEWWQNYSGWYVQHNITKEQFLKYPFINGLNKGDIIAVIKTEYKKGDVIIFDASQEKPIIHRIIETENEISTKGDNNYGQLPEGRENNIQKEKIYGKAFVRIPKLGWAKLFVVEILKAFGIIK